MTAEVVARPRCSDCRHPIDPVALPRHPDHDITRAQHAAGYPQGHPYRVFLDAVGDLAEPMFDAPPRRPHRSRRARR